MQKRSQDEEMGIQNVKAMIENLVLVGQSSKRDLCSRKMHRFAKAFVSFKQVILHPQITKDAEKLIAKNIQPGRSR